MTLNYDPKGEIPFPKYWCAGCDQPIIGDQNIENRHSEDLNDYHAECCPKCEREDIIARLRDLADGEHDELGTLLTRAAELIEEKS